MNPHTLALRARKCREHIQTTASEWEDCWPPVQNPQSWMPPLSLGVGGGDGHRLFGQERTWHEFWRMSGLWESRKVGKVIPARGNNVSKVGEVGKEDTFWEYWINEFYGGAAGSSYGSSLHHGLCPRYATDEGHIRDLHQLSSSCPAFLRESSWVSSCFLSLGTLIRKCP